MDYSTVLALMSVAMFLAVITFPIVIIAVFVKILKRVTRWTLKPVKAYTTK